MRHVSAPEKTLVLANGTVIGLEDVVAMEIANHEQYTA